MCFEHGTAGEKNGGKSREKGKTNAARGWSVGRYANTERNTTTKIKRKNKQRLTHGQPRHHDAAHRQHLVGVAKSVDAGKPVALRHHAPAQVDVAVLHAPQRRLVFYFSDAHPRVALAHDKGVDGARGRVARPHDHNVGKGAVADPALAAVQAPPAPIGKRRRRCLQSRGVRPVGRLRQGPRPHGLEPPHAGDELAPVRVRAQHPDRQQREEVVHQVERGDRGVDARHLKAGEAALHHAEPLAAVGRGQVGAAEVERAHLGQELEGELGALPVGRDDRGDLLDLFYIIICRPGIGYWSVVLCGGDG